MYFRLLDKALYRYPSVGKTMSLRLSALLSFTLLVGAAHAQTFTNFMTEARVMVNEELRENYQENNPNLVTEQVAVGGVGSAYAQGQLTFGVNKVMATFDANNSANPAQTMMANARTQWIDEVVIDGGDLNGTLGTFTASLRVSGTADLAGTGAYATGDADLYGFWDSFIGTSTDGGGSYLVGGWYGSWYTDFEGSIYYEGDELNQPMTEVELEFIYGEPFLLSGMLEVYFDADNYDQLAGTISGTLDFSHSAYWDGMGNFRDANGSPVTINGLTSGSGINWLNPVPEPGTIVALGLGLGALMRKRRKI
jgi:hypothetical protein